MSAATGIQQYCVCHGSDDGRPMIHCDNCDDWFHFACINLDEETAAEIDTFHCQPCTEKTKQETTFSWQLTDEELSFELRLVEPIQPPKQRQKPRVTHSATVSQQVTTTAVLNAPPTFADDSDSEVGMKDDDGEYTGEHQLTRLRRGKQARRAGSPSDGSLSPQDTKQRKRKATTALASTSKRKKTLTARSPTPLSDPVRKYCYGKLLEVIEPIFMEYRSMESEGENKVSDDAAKLVAAKYVAQLENAVFGHYSEPDKKGVRSAGPKYKERFRMLTFNLGHSDRVSLRKGIAAGSILAADLAEMSSAALANEQAKQEMEKAAQEALHQSILKVQTSLPRAKITHKGEEIIESNVSSDVQRVGEEEERERVKMRLRVRTGSILDGNPESASMLSSAGVSSSVFGENRPMEIDIGTPISPEKASFSPLAVHAQQMISPQITPVATTNTVTSPVQLSTNPTAISPRAGPSFSLNSLWSGNEENGNSRRFSFSGADEVSSPVENANDSEEVAMDLDEDQPGEQDFGMFLEGVDEKDPAASVAVKSTTPPPPTKPVERSESPTSVWTGEIVMPLDPDPALVNKVTMRQVGGRPLGSSQTVWSQLLKSNKAVVDGRVAIDRAIKYLVTSCLNASRELIVVAFDTTESSKSKFDQLFDVLIKKERHGLIFPWGPKPSPSAPGKDMYLIPLPASAPLPEFLDLLNHVKIPKKRHYNMLIGAFILNKGKVIVPPLQPATPAPNIPGPTHSTASAVVPQLPLQNDAISSLFSNLGNGPPPAMPFGLSGPPPMIPGMLPPGAPPGLGYSYPPPPMAAPPPPVAPPADALTALTSSIKSMTPDQINLILKGLSMAAPAPAPPSWQPPGVPVTNPGYSGPLPNHDSYPSPSRSPQQGRPREFARDDHYSRDRERRASPPFRGGRGEPYHDDRRERGRGPPDRRGGPPHDGGWDRKRPPTLPGQGF